VAWQTAFIAGWIGVIAGPGAVWQASPFAASPVVARTETNRGDLHHGTPFLPPLIVIAIASFNFRITCWRAFSPARWLRRSLSRPRMARSGDRRGRHRRRGIVISVACLGGRRALRSPT